MSVDVCSLCGCGSLTSCLEITSSRQFAIEEQLFIDTLWVEVNEGDQDDNRQRMRSCAKECQWTQYTSDGASITVGVGLVCSCLAIFGETSREHYIDTPVTIWDVSFAHLYPLDGMRWANTLVVYDLFSTSNSSSHAVVVTHRSKHLGVVRTVKGSNVHLQSHFLHMGLLFSVLQLGHQIAYKALCPKFFVFPQGVVWR